MIIRFGTRRRKYLKDKVKSLISQTICQLAIHLWNELQNEEFTYDVIKKENIFSDVTHLILFREPTRRYLSILK